MWIHNYGDSMKKDYLKYGTILIIAVLIIVFIYPTLYQYDKFDQKIPVRINRVTGSASLLYPTGWEPAESTEPSTPTLPTVTEMDQFKKEMDNRFNNLKQSIEKDMADKLSAQVVASIKSDIDKAKKEIQDYKTAQLDPNNSFGVGSTKEEVKRIMGIPDSTFINDPGNYEEWSYGLSSVKFVNGKVTEWRNTTKNLKLK